MEHREQRRGGSAVEFALTLPILVGVLAATVDYGWYFAQRGLLIQSALAGARAAIFSPVGEAPSQATGVIRARLDELGLDGAAADISTRVQDLNGYDAIVIDVRYPFVPLMDLPVIRTPVELRFDITMRMEDE